MESSAVYSQYVRRCIQRNSACLLPVNGRSVWYSGFDYSPDNDCSYHNSGCSYSGCIRRYSCNGNDNGRCNRHNHSRCRNHRAFFLYKHRHTDVVWIPWVTAGNTVACREEVGKLNGWTGMSDWTGCRNYNNSFEKTSFIISRRGALPPSYTTILCLWRALGSCNRKIIRAG